MSSIRYRYRSSTGYGGYVGKARQNRDRSRAARFDMERMLEEYAEPELAQMEERVIPIRRRSEFLPSAGVVGSEVGYDFADRQMDLPLAPHATNSADDSGCGDEVFSELKVIGENAFEKSDDQASAPEPQGARQITAPCTGPQASADPGGRERAARLVRIDYSVFGGVPGAGLIYGCMIGGAAAAMLLLILRFAIL